MSTRRRWLLFGGVILAFAAVGALHADDNSQKMSYLTLASIRDQFANWVMQGMMWGTSAVVLALWTMLTWGVLHLYQAIGDYLLPIWDFTMSNQHATFLGASIQPWMGVSPYFAQKVTGLGHFFYAISMTVVFLVVVGDAVKVAVNNEDGTRIFAGFGFAVLGMMVFPYLYTGTILLANNLAEAVSYYFKSSNLPQSPVQILSYLTKASFFGTMDAQTQQSIGTGVTNMTGTVANVPAAGANIDLSQTWQQMFGSAQSGASMWTAVATYVNPSPEIFMSRILQIIFCIMGLFEIVALLLLKGAQVAGIVINYYLGILACAMLASPSTRRIFFKWLEEFVKLCMWGFIWALLILVTWFLVGAAQTLTNWAGLLVGAFLFPALLFGALKKWREVSGIVGNWGIGGALVSAVGGALCRTSSQV
jgi:hypothetical protein